ncbi:hypothetical protein [Streptomyces synnematoformans]|uniref:Transposase n=1 Tax=Streptomyces synnematoformans TaxID=415721 RepID=A0ABP5J2W5_9ACTN
MVEFLARLLAAHRRRIGTPRGSRALGPFRQAVLVLRWFREAGCVHCLAREAGISQATGYRYLHEGIDLLAARAPDLHEVLARCREKGMTHVVLDGTLISCDRVAGATERGNDLWYSGKAKHFAGNMQFIAAHNKLLRGIRSLGERAAAELKQRWRALQHVTISPSRIGTIAKAALVLNTSWR